MTPSNVKSATLHSFLELQWNNYLDNTTDDPFLIYCVGFHVVVGIIYWIGGLIYTCFDLYNPKWLQKYKLQPGKNQPVDKNDIFMVPTGEDKVIRQVCYIQFIVTPIVVILGYPIIMYQSLDSPELIRKLPDMSTFVLHIVLCIIFRDFFFYYAHRTLHSGRFYEKHHKRHHYWTAPISIAAQYTDELEHILIVLLPVAIPIVVLRCHLITQTIFIIHATLQTLNDHSGYNFTYYYSSKRHDKHHEVFNQYYGVIGLMDWIHGTNKGKKAKADAE